MTKLRKTLSDLKISQSELARRINVDPRIINRACRTGVQTVRLAKRYARALNCKPLDLIEL